MSICKIQWKLNKYLRKKQYSLFWTCVSLHVISRREMGAEWKVKILKGSGVWCFNNTQIIWAYECAELWRNLHNGEFKRTLFSESYKFKLRPFAGIQRCQGTLVNAAGTRDNPCVSQEQIKKSLEFLMLAQTLNRRGVHCCTVNSKDRSRARRMLCSACESQDQNENKALGGHLHGLVVKKTKRCLGERFTWCMLME